MEKVSKDLKMKSILLTPKEYTALISVHIPFLSLEENRMDQKSVAESIAIKTKTHIECYQSLQLSKIRFCIFGKWRDCLQAGRLLWYQLIRETTIYAHHDWSEELEKPLNDQKGLLFRDLYRSVKYKPLNEYNLLSVYGPCWDVFKVRKELIRRNSILANDQQSVNTESEIIALQILKYIRADIHDHIHIPDSIYSIRNSQLVELLTGSKIITSIHKVEDIRCLKDEQVLIELSETENNNKCLKESDLLVNNSELSKQGTIKSLVSILRQLSAESTDTQILSQIQQLLDSISRKDQKKVETVEEAKVNLRPKRYSELRSRFKLNSNENQSIGLQNEFKLNSESYKMESSSCLINKSNKLMTTISETDQQKDEKREHYLIAERIRELISTQKQVHSNRALNESNGNDHNNECDQDFAKDSVNKSPKDRKFTKEISRAGGFKSNFSKNHTIFRIQNFDTGFSNG